MNATEWPYELQQIVKQIDKGSLEVHAYHLGGFIDDHFLWRLKVSPKQLDQIVVQLNLKPLPADHALPDVFWLRYPWWWPVDDNTAGQQYRSPGFEVDQRGEDGEHFFADYTPESQSLRVWHKSNF